MSGTTDTWVIVVAAFGGGLVGAILQPLLSYAFDRVRAAETIRKNRERSLRRMIFAKIRETRRVQAWAGGIIFGRDPVTDPSPIGGPFWEPHRIKNAELFKNVEAYDKRAARLHTAG